MFLYQMKSTYMKVVGLEIETVRHLWKLIFTLWLHGTLDYSGTTGDADAITERVVDQYAQLFLMI